MKRANLHRMTSDAMEMSPVSKGNHSRASSRGSTRGSTKSNHGRTASGTAKKVPSLSTNPTLELRPLDEEDAVNTRTAEFEEDAVKVLVEEDEEAPKEQEEKNGTGEAGSAEVEEDEMDDNERKKQEKDKADVKRKQDAQKIKAEYTGGHCVSLCTPPFPPILILISAPQLLTDILAMISQSKQVQTHAKQGTPPPFSVGSLPLFAPSCYSRTCWHSKTKMR